MIRDNGFGIVPTGNPLITQVRVPVPYPLKFVNAYLLSGDNGLTVVDPGIRTPEALELWNSVWKELGVGYRDIERIVLTHHHPDHYGLGGLFQERSGAPVFMSELGRHQAELMWGEERTMTEAMWKLFLHHGMDRELADQMIPHMEGFVPLVSPRPEIAIIRNGDTLRLGNGLYEAVETGGHAAGHLSYYRKDTGEMLCGDAVLPHITPNVSYLPGMEEDPLASFLEGLELLGNYRVERAYPGHRDVLTGFSERCKDLIQHHGRRLNQIRDRVAEEPCTAYECCVKLFGTRLSVHQMRFAMSETLAHLIHLEYKGLLRREEMKGAVGFTAVL